MIAGILALAAAWWTFRATRSTAKDQITATQQQADEEIGANREAADREIAASREQIATTIRLQRDRIENEDRDCRRLLADLAGLDQQREASRRLETWLALIEQLLQGHFSKNGDLLQRNPHVSECQGAPAIRSASAVVSPFAVVR